MDNMDARLVLAPIRTMCPSGAPRPSRYCAASTTAPSPQYVGIAAECAITSWRALNLVDATHSAAHCTRGRYLLLRSPLRTWTSHEHPQTIATDVTGDPRRHYRPTSISVTFHSTSSPRPHASHPCANETPSLPLHAHRDHSGQPVQLPSVMPLQIPSLVPDPPPIVSWQ